MHVGAVGAYMLPAMTLEEEEPAGAGRRRMSSKGSCCVAWMRPHVFSCSTSRKQAAATRLLTPADKVSNETTASWEEI